jgi:hypothetical protein
MSWCYTCPHALLQLECYIELRLVPRTGLRPLYPLGTHLVRRSLSDPVNRLPVPQKPGRQTGIYTLDRGFNVTTKQSSPLCCT